VLEHLQAGGLLMIPIVFCSILALAIIVERAIALRKTRVGAPGAAAGDLASGQGRPDG